MNNQVSKYNYMSIGEKSVTFYNASRKKNDERKYQEKSKENLTKRYQSKTLTPKAAKKIKKIVWHWCNAVEETQEYWKKKKMRKRNYVIMITLTLSSKQKISDKEVVRNMLNTFLQNLRNNFENIHYLWVAEKQKNGNIHFHIIADRWINKNWIQGKWNKIQSKYHFIDEYENKFGKRNPPSTHVRGQKEMSNVSSYLTKYVTKAECSLNLDCKKWGCSEGLLSFSNIKLNNKWWYLEEFSYYAKYFKINCYVQDFFSVFVFNKNFHKAFKFLAVYSDILEQLRYYYSLMYNELSSQQAQIVPVVSNKVKYCATQLNLFHFPVVD